MLKLIYEVIIEKGVYGPISKNLVEILDYR